MKLNVKQPELDEKTFNNKAKTRTKLVVITTVISAVLLTTSVVSTAQNSGVDPLLSSLLPDKDLYNTNEKENNDNTKDHTEEESTAQKFFNYLNALSPFSQNREDSSENQEDAGNVDTTATPNDPSNDTNNANDIQNVEPSLYQLLLAEFAYEKGDIDEALTIYKQQSFAKYSTTVFERALSLSMKHEAVDTSLDFAARWHEKNPNHVPAWFYVAHLALRANNYEKASDILEKILAYDSNADLNKILTGIYPQDEANQRQLLTILQKLDTKENASISLLEAGLLLAFDEADIALIHIDRAIRLAPKSEPYLMLKADILKKLNKHTELVALLDTMRKEFPDNSNAYIYELSYLLTDNEVSTPQKHNESLTSKLLNQINIYFDNAEINVDLHNIKRANKIKAWEVSTDAHNNFPDDPDIGMLLAFLSLNLEKYQMCDDILIDLIDRPAFKEKAYFYLGTSAEQQNDISNAIYYFTQIEDEALVLSARKKVVDFYLKQQKVDKALSTLHKLQTDFKQYTIDSVLLQARILDSYDRGSEIKFLLKDAVKAYPQNKRLKKLYQTYQ